MTLNELDLLNLIHKREVVEIKNGSHITKLQKVEYWCEYYGDYEVLFIEATSDGFIRINVR